MAYKNTYRTLTLRERVEIQRRNENSARLEREAKLLEKSQAQPLVEKAEPKTVQLSLF
ncbi:MAG: hypothetical protein IPM39_25040 [Chloroflexi bacterium]|nr:hypothetical protein [Chloroflexota bacterium]